MPTLDNREDARRKRHSTIGEARRIARDMNLQGLLVLTHFSQRYPRSAAPAASSTNATTATAESSSELGPPIAAESATNATSDVCGVTIFAHDHLELRGVCELACGARQKDARFAAELSRELAEASKRAIALQESEDLLQEYFAHDFSAEDSTVHEDVKSVETKRSSE